MPNPALEERSGREIRLLMLVIVVSVAGLLVLARFRFPTAEIVTVSPTPTPLERLTIREPFDDLARVVSTASARVMPVVAVVEFEPVPQTPGRSGAKGAALQPAPRRLGPALRVAPGRLLAYLPDDVRPAIAGDQPAEVLGEDRVRDVALIAEGPAGAPSAVMVDFVSAMTSFVGSSYAIAVEAAPGGPSARPIFIPRVDSTAVEGWETPLLQVGGAAPAPPGVFVFTLDGRLIGLTVPLDVGIAIVGAATLERLAAELAPAEAGAAAEPEVSGAGK